MKFYFKITLLCICSFLLQDSVLAQHPDDVPAVRQKLQQERNKIQQTKTGAVADKVNRMLKLGLWKEAEQLLHVAKLTPDVKLSKVRLALLQNQFAMAERLVEEVLKGNPKHRDALLLRSSLFVQAWELDRAMEKADQVLSQHPKDEEAALAIGRILMLEKNYDEALAWAKKVQQWNNSNAEAYLLESDIHFWNQKPELAEEPLTKSLTLDPFNPNARFNYGYAIWRRVDATQLNAMAAQWELALDLNPLHYVTHWHWGNGHTNLTYADYAQPNDEEVRTALKEAEKLLSQNKIKDAIAEAVKVQQRYNDSVLPAMLRGSAYYMAFDMDRSLRLDSAQTIFENILRRKKHYGPAHNAMAAVIKQKQLSYLAAFDSLNNVIEKTVVKDTVNFATVFPDVTYYPGETVQKMVWAQLYESIVYFPFLAKQGESFVIPPLHIDLTIAMKSPYFRQATTFDNRQWMDIRGVGSGAAGIEYVVRGSFLERNVVLHEYVHLFHGSVFTDEENRAVRRLYQNAMKEGRTLDYYSANNEHEYLAQTYPAYFESVKVHPLNHKSINTTNDLKVKDPELYTFLDKLVERQRAYLAGDKQAMASNWSQVYLNLAEQAQVKQDYTRGAALLDSALIWDKAYQPALIGYANLRLEQKKYVEAKEWLERAGAVEPNYAPIYVAEADLAEVMRRNGKLKETRAIAQQVKLYQKALELEDDLLTKAHINRKFRELYASYGMIPEAIEVAEHYLKDAPTVSTYLRDRRDEASAYANWLKGTARPSSEAAEALAKLVSLKPQNYELRQQYADVLSNLGHYQKAFDTLEEAQRILAASGSARPSYMVRQADYKLYLGDISAAREVLQPIFSGKVKMRTDLSKLAGVYARLGEVKRAQNLIMQLPDAVTPADKADKMIAVGRLWEALGKPNLAEKSYSEVIKKNPYHHTTRLHLVSLLQKNGKQKEAERVLLAGNKLRLSDK